MPKWMKPSEELPECNVGDAIAIIVVERQSAKAPLRPSLVILIATEGGWQSSDPVYAGYSVEDGVLWSYEQDVCAIARVVVPEAFD